MKRIRDFAGRHRLGISILLSFLFVLLLLMAVRGRVYRNAAEVDYNSFMEMTEARKIQSVEIREKSILFTDEAGKRYRCGKAEDPELAKRLYAAGADFAVLSKSDLPGGLLLFMAFSAEAALVWGIYVLLSGILGMKAELDLDFLGIESISKPREPLSTALRFSDVAGQEEAGELLMEIVDYLHAPDAYKKIGARIPKGALLIGPPGTGKTLLAGAAAGEAGVPFFSLAGSEFVELYVGLGAKRVRDLFRKARENAPCILFIDEIDAVGKKRRDRESEEWEQTLNQLLVEMDGLDPADGVVLLAATNRPEALDPALLRPGRFDRHIPVELPDKKGREEILKVHAKKLELAGPLDFSSIARAAAGASGADLAKLMNEAALRAVRKGRRAVEQEDLEESLELLIAGGRKKNCILSPREKRIAACHEMGHALVAALQDPEAPVHRISIIPRLNGALGYTLQIPAAEERLLDRKDLENKLSVYAAGRAAEELFFQTASTGAANDSKRLTELARAMVCRYGMSESFGMVSFEGVGSGETDCSLETQTAIDREILRLAAKAHERASRILSGNRERFRYLAEELYTRETLSGEEFKALLKSCAEQQEAGKAL